MAVEAEKRDWHRQAWLVDADNPFDHQWDREGCAGCATIDAIKATEVERLLRVVHEKYTWQKGGDHPNTIDLRRCGTCEEIRDLVSKTACTPVEPEEAEGDEE